MHGAQTMGRPDGHTERPGKFSEWSVVSPPQLLEFSYSLPCQFPQGVACQELSHSLEHSPTRPSPALRSETFRTEPRHRSSGIPVHRLATRCPQLLSQKRSPFPMTGTTPVLKSAHSDFWRIGQISRPRRHPRILADSL